MRILLQFLLTIFVVLCVVMLMASATELFGQTGALMPYVYPVFNNTNGVTPVANGFVCTTSSGTSTPLATYRENTNTTVNQNPVRLNAQGRAVNGSTLVPIFLQPLQYRITLYAAGTGNTCNSVTVGTQVWQQDNVYDFGQLMAASLVTITSLNNRQYCTTGATFGAMFTAAAALLPSTGGIIDCSNRQGAQTISSDVFTGETKNILLLWPSGTATSSVSLTIPANITVWRSPASVLSMDAGTTVTFAGQLLGPLTNFFAGLGTIRVTSVWWNANLNGTDRQLFPLSLGIGAVTGMTATAAVTTGATLGAGTYFYKVYPFDGNTLVGTPSAEVSVVVGGANNSVNVAWTVPTGVSIHRVQRGTSTGSSNCYFTSTNAATFADTGQACTAASGAVTSGTNLWADIPGSVTMNAGQSGLRWRDYVTNGTGSLGSIAVTSAGEMEFVTGCATCGNPVYQWSRPNADGGIARMSINAAGNTAISFLGTGGTGVTTGTFEANDLSYNIGGTNNFARLRSTGWTVGTSATTAGSYGGNNDTILVAGMNSSATGGIGLLAVSSSNVPIHNGATRTLANTATSNLSTNTSFRGLVTVHIGTDNAMCLFLATGAGGTTVELSDPSAICSITAATATSINFYYTGTLYQIENLRGGSRDLTISLLGN